MLKIHLDVQDLVREEFGRITYEVRRRVTQSLDEGHKAVVAATPVDTGFLRASWWTEAEGGSVSGHPDPPNYEVKREYDRGIRKRQRGGSPVWGADEQLSGMFPSERTGYAVAVRNITYSYNNDAPYGPIVDAKDPHAGFVGRATYAAATAIINSLQSG